MCDVLLAPGALAKRYRRPDRTEPDGLREFWVERFKGVLYALRCGIKARNCLQAKKYDPKINRFERT
jgi:hypothetical protein